jgi:hypothetical protein
MSKQGTGSARQLASVIGKRVTILTAAEGLTVHVRVEDARRCFGRTDLYCVMDQVSEGAWIDSRCVIFGRED